MSESSQNTARRTPQEREQAVTEYQRGLTEAYERKKKHIRKIQVRVLVTFVILVAAALVYSFLRDS